MVALWNARMTFEEMVEKFQCPGCVAGSDTKCGVFTPNAEHNACDAHVLGIMIGLGNSIALGLPNGFNKPGINWSANPPRAKNKIHIRLWTATTQPQWDHLNVPVWAMVEDGFLFVRTYSPRINKGVVDVIESGNLSMVPNAIDVSKFIDEID
jgi:hypothetical protein